MTNTQPARKNKTPDQVVFKLRNLKNGQYPIQGDVSSPWWQALCQELGFPPEGGGSVDLVLDISFPRFRVYGTLKMAMKRQCVRSLDTFLHKTTTHIDEHLTLKKDTGDGGEIYHEGDILDMGEYLRQQFILAVDPHPIKDDGQRGGVVLSDGLEDSQNQEKENPFAILKDKFEQE